jgi:hypothetical protein
MIKNNNIDIFFIQKTSFKYFSRIITTAKNKKLNFISQLNINDDLSKKHLNQITILDEDSLENFINKKIDLNNYIFIVGQ